MFDFGKKRREKKQRILFQEMQKSKMEEIAREKRLALELLELENQPKRCFTFREQKIGCYWELYEDKNGGKINEKRLVEWARRVGIDKYKYKCKIQERAYDPTDPAHKGRVPWIDREGVFFFDDPKLLEKYLDRPGNRAGIGDAEVASFLYQKWCRYAEDKERGSTYTGILIEDLIYNELYSISAEHLDDYFYEEDYAISKSTGTRYYAKGIKELVERYKRDGYVYDFCRWYPYEEAEKIYEEYLKEKEEKTKLNQENVEKE